ncbi:MutS-related protein [Dyadobacter sp. CY312]|uniref:MutS-related protein n=1 Tax=Dyadobacter sp. CY312 TaxID=2907303 RepID=UPI001F173E5B|nr:DNA mismatch repair protein MutS [Dyadobacter sp. CY312]MCE7040864.1 DNA mismatch repair protein MutS [Dyadobacter sp. CY312]
MHIFQNKIEKYGSELAKLGSVLSKLSLIRLIVFILSFGLVVFLANKRFVVPVLLLIPLFLLGFTWLIKYFQKLSFQKKHIEFLKQINENELLRQQNKFSGFPTGERFIDRNHDYASDFDIFGSHSLFQLINRSTTESADQLLARWLSEPAPETVILERQKAIKELSAKLDWRQNFQASGMHHQNAKSDYNKLLAWIEKPVDLLPRQSKYLIISIILSAISTASLIYYGKHLVEVLRFNQNYSFWSMLPLAVSLIVNSRFLKTVRSIAEETVRDTQHNVKILAGYYSLIAKIESEPFESEILKTLQSVFRNGSYSASGEINVLKRILEIFQNRGTKGNFKHQFYPIFNNFWLFDIHLIILTEKWKNKNSQYLKSWVSAISEVEELSSLAGFSYANSTFTFPEIVDEPYVIDFRELGHPLISTQRRVSNDFNLTGRGEIAMITGSNMAGKSTFLRTVGVNLVLALMGAPCCAAHGRVSHMKIFTSMRTQDNLEEGISSFYAELKRIEQLLKLIESGEQIFFLLDEMFKGTNSQDRYRGGASLIKQLNELNAFGIISTHDLELANLTVDTGSVANFSFNSIIQEGEIIFNYKLTEGICTDFNASELMKKSGIKII